MTDERCLNCDKRVRVMTQKGTGFCTPRCEEEYDE